MPSRPPGCSAGPATGSSCTTCRRARSPPTSTPTSRSARKIAEAESIASDLRRADAEFKEVGVESTRFAPRTSAICSWCDFRAHCPEGQQMGPEKSDWAGLEPAGYDTTPPERDHA